MDTNRLETFSDGVIAIAITLLVLEIDVPRETHGGLWRKLLQQWPSYLAYLISFAVIGIIWVNHHGILALVARIDRPLLYLNLLLLLTVAGIPFPTALVAEHLRSPGIDAAIAAAVYGGWATLVALSFNVMWRWIVHDARLIHEHLDLAALRSNTRRFSLGLVIYPVTIGIAFLSPIWALVVHGLVAIYY
ncbi:MAG: TMEM175 family protein, partial [Actinomycetota bacterium]